MHSGAIAVATLLMASCGVVQEARMSVPAGLTASADTFAVRGMGAGRSGDVVAGEYSGKFHRSASRLALFDVLERDSASGGFELHKRDDGRTVDGRCDMRRQTVSAGVVSFAPNPMSYQCVFSTAGAPIGRMALYESDGPRRRRERQGEVHFGEQRLALRSVHQLVGTPLRVEAPIGYVIESRGRAIGAIEINGIEPSVVIDRRASAQEREAIWLAALATALLWDPADQR